MKSGHHGNVAVDPPFAAEARDALVGFQQKLRGELAEGDDHLGLHEVDLPLEVAAAGGDLVGLRIPILGRTALQDVRDVDGRARQPHAVLDHPREKLARAPHERHALRVLVGSRGLADEHDPRAG